MMDPHLVSILRCPETKEPLQEASPERIEALNKAIEAGTVQNRAGQPVSEKIDAGLVRAGGKWLYPVRADIPVMLIEEAIPL